MRIVQISDLHFGRDRPELLEPLTLSIGAAEPDLIVIAGDFVQRARAAQYRPARRFVDRLSGPWVAVPGNHDIPLYNLPARLFRPYGAYRRWISDDLEPVSDTREALILGVNTSDPFAHQRGRIRPAQIARVASAIESAEGRTVFVVAHHPFHHRPEVEKKLMVGAPDALDAWAEAGPHVILSGHLHQWLVEPFVTRKGGRHTLQIHTGTGLSSRLRGAPNDFAVIDVDDGALCVTRMIAPGDSDRFEASERQCFRVLSGSWEWLESESSPARRAI